MPNPEQGQSPLDQATGSWLGFDLAIPDFLQPVREAINSIAQLLIAFLNLLLAILDLIKAFLTAFLDPLIALIEALIALVEQIINDLRNAGFYLHGDWYLLKEGPEFRNLLGGFSAYERRMITRLIDTRDPDRPNLSPFSVVIALFFYVSADATTVIKLINFIRGILMLFGRGAGFRAKTLGRPTDLRAVYGIEGATENINSLKPLFSSLVDRRKSDSPGLSAEDLNLVTLQWKLASAPGNFVSTIAPMVPNGFLIEVSTEPNPLFVAYDTLSKGVQPVDATSSAQQPPDPPVPRIRGLCVDEEGNTLQLTGGADQFRFEAGNPVDFGNRASPRIYAYKNSADLGPIDISALRDGDKYYLQRTFFVSGIQAGGITPGNALSTTLKLSDMPLTATFDSEGKLDPGEPTDTFYVRVRSVSPNVDSPTDFQFRVGFDTLNLNRAPVVVPVGNPAPNGEKMGLGDRGDPSNQIKITFPNANTADYLRCVQTALLVMVLSRPDLLTPVNEFGQPLQFDPNVDDWEVVKGKVSAPTGLEDIAKRLLPQITGRRNSAKFYGADDDVGFRQELYDRCAALAGRMYRENNPPPSIQKLVVDTCQPLLLFTLGDNVLTATDATDQAILEGEFLTGATKAEEARISELTLIEAMLDENPYVGVGLNPGSVGNDGDDRAKTKLQYERDLSSTVLPSPFAPEFFEINNSVGVQEAIEAELIRLAELEAVVEGARQAFQESDIASDAFNETLVELIDAERGFETLAGQPVFSSETVKAATENNIVKGSVEQAPVIYVRRANRIKSLVYCRNVFRSEGLMDLAAFALNVAAGPGSTADGGWITARLGQLIPDIGQFLDEILAWIKALAAALDSIAKAIRRFIEYLQARIIELQMLIARINALLQSLLRIFDILPQGAILPVVTKGTSGVLTALVSAQNKPSDSATSYGGGAVVLASAGPLFPAFFLDIFAGK